MRNIRFLPTFLKKAMKSISMEEDKINQDISDVQETLEATIEAQSESPENVYHYLVCTGVLRLFGMDLDNFVFGYNLSNIDLNSMSKMLEVHLKCFDSMQNESKQQAYVLNLALCNTRDQRGALLHVLNKLPAGLCEELIEAGRNVEEILTNLRKLEEQTEHLLNDGNIKLRRSSLVLSIKSQLHHLHQHERLKMSAAGDATAGELSPEVEGLMNMLDMKKYYPQKIKYDDVIKLTSEFWADVKKKPTSLVELPWYFIKHIICLDSDTRENCHVFSTKENDDDIDSDDESVSDVHPLDLMYILILCADDFLRQELADKMTKCQYAVPFILRSPEHSPLKGLALYWGLESITRTFVQDSKVINKPLVDVETPLVACMNIGKEMSWKSKLMNKMLSPQQETFWHQGLMGGTSKQVVSNGMVEVAWYLPGNHGDNKFPCPVTFLNLRDDKGHCNKWSQLNKLCSVSCIFTAEINDELRSFLKSEPSLEKLILVVLHRNDEEKTVKEEVKELQDTFKLMKHQIIRKTAEDSNFNKIYAQLNKSIRHVTKNFSETSSISRFVQEVDAERRMDVDNKKCYHAQMAAKSILKDIDEFNQKNPGSAKAEILPCQSDLKTRQEIASLDKELCRQRKLRENTTVQNYAFYIKDTKWRLQLGQLCKPVSATFLYFLASLLGFVCEERKYFLQYLKLGLNQRSVEMLKPLNEEYEKCRLREESEEKEQTLKALDEKLRHGSLGLEHFFREMAVMYENILLLKEKAGHVADLDNILDLLSGSMADVLMEGTAIEIMDGDAVTIPVEWLKAVFLNVERSTTSTVFKVSVLGAQSCGKSTLLNTAFGLNFPVSSGRCTRGAYLQLVKVDESLKETLRCDYVAVIDSEGLMSRSKTSDCDYDNELSTFIIGLSDLTLVIIKGEGNEMNDVLPLAIHVFLRMNIVGEHQSCRFVHQNMGAVDAMTKVATEIDAFVRDLNLKTLTAAMDVGWSDRYTKFTDVLYYDPVKDNTYLCTRALGWCITNGKDKFTLLDHNAEFKS